MSKGFDKLISLARSFLRSRDGATSIEYAVMASGVAIVIVAAVGVVGGNLDESYQKIAGAFR
jgi:pilus assembly protein Flp/PilA